VGKDRIVPPKSDPIDLAVFCVEPGRWVATKYDFGSFLLGRPANVVLSTATAVRALSIALAL
jgi:hypothetical protein